MIYIVYCTTNIVNKKIYIGVHKCENNKFDGYLGNGVYENEPHTYNKPKYPFQFAVQKYGPKKFKRITIKEFDNAEDAYSLEAELVNEDFLKRKDVYNIALGGHGGDIAQLAVKCYQYDTSGNFLAEYKSYQEAATTVNRGFTTIKRAIKEKIKAGNSYWSLEKVDKLDLSQYKTTNNKIPVFQYSQNGEYDCCYESISDAARVINSEPTLISRAIKLGYLVNSKYFSLEFQSHYSKARENYLRGKHVFQYSLSGEFLKEYNSCAEAERALNAKQGLSTALKLGRTFAGYQWSLEKLGNLESVEIKFQARKVGQYDLDGNLIKIFNTVTECRKEFSGCRHVLSGRSKTSGGYIFKYIE